MDVIAKLPNSEHSYKGKVKTHKYINRLMDVIEQVYSENKPNYRFMYT